MPHFNKKIESIPPSGIRKFFDLVIGADDIISLGVGEPDFVTPWHIRENVFYSLEKGNTSYTSNSGLKDLRQKIAEYQLDRFSNHYTANEILITVGASEAVDISFRTILNEGDEVIVPEPTYVCYKPLLELAGGVSVTVSNPGVKITAKDIEKAITNKTKAIVLSYPSNPTGYTIEKKELKAIGKLAQKHDFWIISDEIYGELSYEIKHFSIASMAEIKDRVILISGFSKAFAMTGWRVGYIAANTEFLDRATKIHQYSALCAPIMSQYGALEALNNGLPEMEKMKNSYLQRRNYMYKELNRIGLTVNKPEGAFYIFPSIKSTGLSSEEFALGLLKKHKVAVVPGNVFGDSGEGYLRLCYATDFNLLKEAIHRIELFIKGL